MAEAALGAALLPHLRKLARNVLGQPGRDRRANRRRVRRTRRAGRKLRRSNRRNRRLSKPNRNVGAPVQVGAISTVQYPDTMVFSRRELMYNVYSSATANAFISSAIVVAPTNYLLSPAIAQMAPMYQKFKFTDLWFEYIPSCATTQTGQVGITLYTDVDHPEIISAEEMTGGAASQAGQAFEKFNVSVPLEVFTPLVAGIVDASVEFEDPNNVDKMSAYGQLVIGAWNSSTTSTLLGSVYVHYELELSVPMTTPLASTLMLHLSNTTGGALGALDFSTFDDVGDPHAIPLALIPSAPTTMQRMHRNCYVQILIDIVGAAAVPTLTVTSGGVAVTTTRTVSDGVTQRYAVYECPPGRGNIAISSNVAWATCRLMCIAHHHNLN